MISSSSNESPGNSCSSWEAAAADRSSPSSAAGSTGSSSGNGSNSSAARRPHRNAEIEEDCGEGALAKLSSSFIYLEPGLNGGRGNEAVRQADESAAVANNAKPDLVGRLGKTIS